MGLVRLPPCQPRSDAPPRTVRGRASGADAADEPVPDALRSAAGSWERVARLLLSRLHRESLADPGDGERSAVWSRRSSAIPTCRRLAAARFLAAERADLDAADPARRARPRLPLRIESYFPLDEATARACERFWSS